MAKGDAVRSCTLAIAILAIAGSVAAQVPAAPSSAAGNGPPSIRLNSENVRLNNYLHELAGPGAFLGAVGGGVLAQIRHSDDGLDDVSTRIGTRVLQRSVDLSVRHGLAALMHQSTDYQPCHCHGFGNKVKHALLESFTARRDDGSRALAIPRFAGSYASSFTELAWNHSRNAGDALLGTTLSFGFSALFNVAKELTGLAR
jgi:hypothetical protein